MEGKGRRGTYLRIYAEEESKVNTVIMFENLDSDDYEEVTITIQMTGASFDFTAELKYYNQVLTLAFSSFPPWLIVCM